MGDGSSIAGVKVPVGEVVAESYRAVFGQLGLFLDLAWLPFLIQLAISIVPPLLVHFAPAGRLPAVADQLPDYLELAGLILCVTAFAVRWYAAMLFVDGRALPRRAFLKAWLRFVVYAAVLFAVPLLMGFQESPERLVAESEPGLDAALQNTVVAFLMTVRVALGILAFLAYARFSLLFPAAAYGRPLGWAEAWRRMRGNTWRNVGCLLLTTVPFVLAVSVLVDVALILTGFPDEATQKAALSSTPGGILLSGLSDTIVFFIAFALGASILMGFYRRLVLHRPT